MSEPLVTRANTYVDYLIRSSPAVNKNGNFPAIPIKQSTCNEVVDRDALVDCADHTSTNK